MNELAMITALNTSNYSHPWYRFLRETSIPIHIPIGEDVRA